MSEGKVPQEDVSDRAGEETRNKFEKMLRDGLLEEKEIEISIQDNSSNSSSFVASSKFDSSSKSFISSFSS